MNVLKLLTLLWDNMEIIMNTLILLKVFRNNKTFLYSINFKKQWVAHRILRNIKKMLYDKWKKYLIY